MSVATMVSFRAQALPWAAVLEDDARFRRMLGRVLAAELSTRFGRQFIVDNKGGAAGNIGTAEVAKAKPDGYTLVLGYVGTHAINKSLYSTLGYDPQKSFAPISQISNRSFSR